MSNRSRSTSSSSPLLVMLFLATSSGAFQMRNFASLPPSKGIDRGAYSIRPNRGNPCQTRASTEDDFDLTSLKIGDRDFWTRQKELAEQMTQGGERTAREEQTKKYQRRADALVADTAFFTFLIFPTLWLWFDNPLFSLSYLLGSSFGLAYSYGLGKYVATLGGSVDDVDTLKGAGVGEARFAFLILLLLFVGKFRSMGLVEIPCIAGFFTYQLASLSQGLREFND